MYAEAKLNYVMLYTATKKMMVYVTIKSLEEQLPADQFIRVHKSFIVNISKVRSIEGNILDIGNVKITISQSLREKVVAEIIKDKNDQTLGRRRGPGRMVIARRADREEGRGHEDIGAVEIAVGAAKPADEIGAGQRRRGRRRS